MISSSYANYVKQYLQKYALKRFGERKKYGVLFHHNEHKTLTHFLDTKTTIFLTLPIFFSQNLKFLYYFSNC